MKKIKFISYILLFSITGFFVSCVNDEKDKYLDQYKTILYFLNSGVQKIDLYKTGENTIYPVNITKAGSNLSSVAEIEIVEAEQSLLDTYNEENLTQYTPLPKEYYSLGDNAKAIKISAEESYINHNIEFYTDKTDQLIEENIEKKYALALSLFSRDSINSEKNFIIIDPNITTPVIQFGDIEKTDIVIEPNQTDNGTLSIPVRLSIINKWDFTTTVEVQNELIDEYNKNHKTNYKALNSNQYTISNNGELAFTSDDDSKELTLTINTKNLNNGLFLIPLKLTKISNKDFGINEEKGVFYCIVNVKSTPIELTEDMLSSNATEPSEGSLANLLDGDTGTYFHTAWSVTIPEAHYLLVSLKNPVKKFSFDFIGRSNNGNALPAEIVIEGSKDGDTFTHIITIENDQLPTGALAKYSSQVYEANEFKFLKFTVTKNKTGGKFFVWSEFRLFEAKR